MSRANVSRHFPPSDGTVGLVVGGASAALLLLTETSKDIELPTKEVPPSYLPENRLFTALEKHTHMVPSCMSASSEANKLSFEQASSGSKRHADDVPARQAEIWETLVCYPAIISCISITFNLGRT